MRTKLFTAFLVLTFILGINTTTKAANIDIICNQSIDGQVFYKANASDVYVLHFSNDEPNLWGWDWYEGIGVNQGLGMDPTQSLTIDLNYVGAISYYQYSGIYQYDYDISFTLMGVMQTNTDATLSDLTANSNTLDGFSPAIYTYNVELPTGTTVVPTLVGTPMNANAAAVTTAAATLPGTSTVLVTAQDGTTTETYTVNFTVAPANTDASLSDLTVNGSTVVNFSPITLEYDVVLPAGTTTVPTVVGTANQTTATVTIGDASSLPGTTEIFVVAQDGLTSNLYKIHFTVYIPNTDASLSDLTINGSTVTNFNTTTLTYNVELPSGTITVPTVVGILTDANATAVTTNATALPGTSTVLVTAEDGTTIQNYTVIFSLALNTDATLSDLTVNGTTVTGFVPATLTYNIELPYGTTAIPTVIGTPTDVNAASVTTDATALPGSTVVLVTAEDGTTIQNYTVNFTVALNSDATLIDLTVNGITVSGFAPSTYTYNLELPYGTTIIPTIVGTPTDANAIAVSTDATVLPGTATVLVTAEDGTTTQTYTVNFTVALSTDATLSDLTVNGTTVTNFSSITFTYNVELPAGTTTVPTVVGTPTDLSAAVITTDATALPGTATVLVTAEDGITTETYTISFTVANPDIDATLSDLSINGATVTDFLSTTLIYNVELPYGTTAIPTVVGTPTVVNAIAVTTDATALPGTSTVLVTAEDGTTTQTYTINFTVAPASVNTFTNTIKIYPNPTNGIFTIELNEVSNTNIEIIDISGKIIKQFTIKDKKISVNLTNQVKGVYFIKINNNEIVKTERIIVK